MKFSDIQESGWAELRPYLDTCLLPVTGLSGAEAPWEATQELERLRDALDLLEIPFKGRIVTYPAMHFAGTSNDGEPWGLLDDVCLKLKTEAGFRHVVIVTAKTEQELPLTAANADLILRFGAAELKDSPDGAKRRAAGEMALLWQPQAAIRTDV
ncbi:DUF2487 family protein [Paenibacillus allorhizosphaerae]|uniref:DUF2487 family protein n=1 Tax=Paenibacillus allorhizosphaerae TaxID=2849866 RepID=A0ABM8VLQ3_9BACL|nr:DUF2487 family protein [Paenibacillus allorhizosphaerae]CAG7648838.1 hypothetical protein PAECIP111802_04344 [Paenibacillus allorhizosphaerae]